MASHHSSRRGPKSSTWKRSGLLALLLAVLVLVCLASYWVTERRQEIAAADARSYTRPSFPSVSASAAPTTTRPKPSTTQTDLPSGAAPIVETTAPGAPADTPTRPETPEAADQSFLELLTVSGYSLTPENSQSYVDRARDACTRLGSGINGQDVVNDAVAAAEREGMSRREGEGLLYIGVASYCQQLAPTLP